MLGSVAGSPTIAVAMGAAGLVAMAGGAADRIAQVTGSRIFSGPEPETTKVRG